MALLISVIVPIYNSEKYLAQCLDSILDYSGQEIEVILVDDGSTDSSVKIARSYSDRRVIVCSQENQGPGAARNHGIQLSKGKYIMFVDSDDWLEPGSIEKILAMLCSTRETALLFDSIAWKSDTQKRIHRLPLPIGYCYDSEEQKEELIKQLLITFELNSPCDKVYSGKVIRDNRILFPAIHYGEDSIFNLEYFNKSEEEHYVSEAFYNYRHNPLSLTKKYDPKVFSDLSVLCKYRLNFSGGYFYGVSADLEKVISHQIKGACLSDLSACIVIAKQCCIKNSDIQMEVYKIPVCRELLQTQVVSAKAKIQQFLLRFKLYDLLILLHKINQFRISCKGHKIL